MPNTKGSFDLSDDHSAHREKECGSGLDINLITLKKRLDVPHVRAAKVSRDNRNLY